MKINIKEGQNGLDKLYIPTFMNDMNIQKFFDIDLIIKNYYKSRNKLNSDEVNVYLIDITKLYEFKQNSNNHSL